MQTKINTIGIDDNLNRTRIRKLLAIGLFGALLTGAGDFLLGYAEEVPVTDMALSIVSGAADLTDGQIIAGSMLGMFGVFLESLACFGVYRLMADAAPKYAHIYRSGIFGNIWLAPIGCHLNMGVLILVYKYLLAAGQETARKAVGLLFYSMFLPVYILLVIFWLPMMVIQFMAFAKGMTPYPSYAKWFSIIIGAVPAMVICRIPGIDPALANAIGTMFLSFGNAFMFGGLLAALPRQEAFDRFKSEHSIKSEN